MKNLTLMPSLAEWLALVSFSVSVHAAEDDFVPLFNGKDFAGWRFGEASAVPKQTRPQMLDWPTPFGPPSKPLDR